MKYTVQAKVTVTYPKTIVIERADCWDLAEYGDELVDAISDEEADRLSNMNGVRKEDLGYECEVIAITPIGNGR